MDTQETSNVICLNTRRHVRRTCDWEAQARVGDLLMTGRVLDYSSGGVFFVPEESYADGRFLHGDEVLDELGTGTPVLIQVFDRASVPRSEIKATVRWTGFSQAHGCSGFGSEAESVTIGQEPPVSEALRMVA